MSRISKYLTSIKGGELSMTHYTQTHNRGTRSKAILCVCRYKQLIIFRYRMIFLGINIDFFSVVVDYPKNLEDHVSLQYHIKFMCRKKRFKFSLAAYIGVCNWRSWRGNVTESIQSPNVNKIQGCKQYELNNITRKASNKFPMIKTWWLSVHLKK